MSAVTPGKGRGRKPVSVGTYGTQDKIWQLVRQLREFSTYDLISKLVHADIPVNDGTLISYLRRLTLGGYLRSERPARAKRGEFQAASYTLIKDTGIDTPRLRADGTPSDQGAGRQQLWNTMQILTQFDYEDLAIHASTEACVIAAGTAAEYCKLLCKAGYLAITRASKPGTKAMYRMIPSKFTGPKPPQVQKLKRIWDANLRKVMWEQGVQS